MDAVDTFGEDIELGEFLGILLAIGIGIYLLYKVYQYVFGGVGTASNSMLATGIRQIFSSPTATGEQTYVGSGKPLTALQAQSIAVALGMRCSWKLSCDKTQIWFFDGSYWDNTTGHYYLKDGTDKGSLSTASGYCVPCTQANNPPIAATGTGCVPCCGVSATC